LFYITNNYFSFLPRGFSTVRIKRKKGRKKLIFTCDGCVKINIIKKYKFARKKGSKKDKEPMRRPLDYLSPIMFI
jgi:hypothetical protein